MNKLEEVVNVTTNKNNYISLKNNIKNKISIPNSEENKIFTQSGLNQNDFAEKFIIYLERNFINNDSIQQSETNDLSGKIEFTLNNDIPTEQYNNFLNSLNNKQPQQQTLTPEQTKATQKIENELSNILGDNWVNTKSAINNWVEQVKQDLVESLTNNYLKSLYGRIDEAITNNNLIVNYISQLLVNQGLKPNTDKIINKINQTNNLKNLSDKIDYESNNNKYQSAQGEEEKNYEEVLGFTEEDKDIIKEKLDEYLNKINLDEIIINILNTYKISLKDKNTPFEVDPNNKSKANTVKKRVKTNKNDEGIHEVDKIIEVIDTITYPIVIDIAQGKSKEELQAALLSIRNKVSKKLKPNHRDYIDTKFNGNTFYGKGNSPIKKYYNTLIGKKADVSDNLDSMYFTITTKISDDQVENTPKNFILGKSRAGQVFKSVMDSLPKDNAWTKGMIKY